MGKLDDVIEEMRAVSEADRLRQEREAFIEDKDIVLNGYVLGRLEDLPLWAQSYIKWLRDKAWGKNGR